MTADRLRILRDVKQIFEMLQAQKISSLEKDILKEKLRSVYEQLDKIEIQTVGATSVHTAQTAPVKKQEEKVPEPVQTQKQVVVEEEKPVVIEPKPEPKVETTAKEDDIIKKVAASTNKILQQGQQTDEPAPPPAPKPAEKKVIHVDLSQDNLVSLKSLIDLNKKFFFVSELFGGDGNAYDSFVTRLDSTSTFENAISMLNFYKRERPNWEAKAHALEVMEKVLAKKFGAATED